MSGFVESVDLLPLSFFKEKQEDEAKRKANINLQVRKTSVM